MTREMKMGAICGCMMRGEREYVVYVIGIERGLACFPDRTMGGGREREQTREGREDREIRLCGVYVAHVELRMSDRVETFDIAREHEHVVLLFDRKSFVEIFFPLPFPALTLAFGRRGGGCSLDGERGRYR